MKTITYTEIPYRELEALVAEHLGVAVEDPSDYRTFHNFSVPRDLESGNDTKHCVGDLESWLQYGEVEELPLTYQYIFKLQEMGHIPKEHPVLLDIWW